MLGALISSCLSATMEKIEAIDVSPGHQHQEFVEMHSNERAWATREPYGPGGEFIPSDTAIVHSHDVGFKGLFSNYYVAMCATFATIGGLLFGYEYVSVSTLR